MLYQLSYTPKGRHIGDAVGVVLDLGDDGVAVHHLEGPKSSVEVQDGSRIQMEVVERPEHYQRHARPDAGMGEDIARRCR